MTKELAKVFPYEELVRAYNAYNALMMAYENALGGPYRAREYKEYFSIRDSRENIRLEVVRRATEDNDGNR